jgi:hypothetical protein
MSGQELANPPSVAELDRIERELEIYRSEIEDLRQKTRAIEVEMRPRGAGLGFLVGFGGVFLLEVLLVALRGMR